MVLRRVGVIASVVLLGLAAASTTAAREHTVRHPSFIGPFTGVGVGGQHRVGHSDNNSTNPDNHVVSDSDETYQGQFNYSFRIENGVIEGTGNGDYKTATWDLSGVNGKNGSFSCSPPVHTHPFSVRVWGWATDGHMYIGFDLLDANETNDNYDCGAEFTGRATTSRFLPESLEAVLLATPGGLALTSVKSPSIGHLTAHAEDSTDTTSHTVDSAWDITISGPSGGTDNPGGPGPSTGKRRGPGTKICTITGTPGRDVLHGTAGHDVICGLGGNDVLTGLGGDDILFGGPGNDSLTGGAGRDLIFGDAGKDTISAKDGESDRIDGGAGRDSAKRDAGKDRVSAVEKVSG
ncbi:MAG: large repetitive protein [Gaiellaceae bacterium]|nr:large repetitive protein [Gaiellaceae bacterium]